MLESLWNNSRTAVIWIFDHLVFLNMVLSVVIIFFQRRKPSTVWAWLLVLYFIPILGFGLYLVLGQDHRKNRMFRMKEIEEELKYAVRRQEESISRNQMRFRDSQMQQYQGLMLYNLNAAESVLTDNNDVRIYFDGMAKFTALTEEIERAQKYIHIEYYIIKNDIVWQKLETVLAGKVKEGVKVRVLYDSMGGRMMKKKDWKRIRELGMEVGEFFPALFGKLHMRLNYRNHRKIVVIDGKVAFLGGFNIGKEYVGADRRFGYWRDTHLCIEGAAVTSLAVRFVMDWNYATGQNLFLEDSLFEMPVYEREGKVPLQIISSGPDSLKQEIRNNYLKLINEAKDHIYIQSPYFILDETIMTALVMAAQTGVEVKIMIPCKPDHPFVYWASYSYLGEMLEAGAKCYTYENGFLHAKMVTIDGMVSCCGTANMDIRSFELNFEVNATIYCANTTQKLEQAFRRDLNQAAEIDREFYRKRGFMIRAKEQVSRLLSPIL